MSDKPGNGWDQYQRVVLYRLDSLAEQQDFIEKQLQTLSLEVARINTYQRVTSAVFGFLAGAIPAAISLVYELFSK